MSRSFRQTIRLWLYGDRQSNQKEQYLRAFFLALLIGVVIFLPFVIFDKGYFVFYGDFNAQQIPFYKMAHEAVHNGDLLWSFKTDLGVNFIGTYSFYLIGSPFFWLTVLFPNWLVPYLMAPLLILKFAIASLGAYSYLTKFVKNKDYALIGAILYAFSGYSLCNVFFNHFLDVVALFPFLLTALEDFLQKDRRGFFAAMVCINAVNNYFFFVGQVVFLLIYFLIRLLSKDVQIKFSKFLWLCFESLLGVACACFMLLPSALAVMGNPRVSEALLGYDVFLYPNVQRYFAILQSFFFPPEHQSMPNFFPDANNKWASLGAFLPLFAMTGVIAFTRRNKKSWLTRTLLVLYFMAFIPILNSAFYAFNRSYYARWHYMLVLMMVLATTLALDDLHPEDFKVGIKWSAIVVGAMFLFLAFTPKEVDGKVKIFSLTPYVWRFLASTIIAAACLVILYILIQYKDEMPYFSKFTTFLVCVVTVLYSIYFIAVGKNSPAYVYHYIDIGIESGKDISLPDPDTFSRVDVLGGLENQAMFWGLPTIQAFNSVVPASIMEFYPTVGVTRDVASRPAQTYYALRSLLSVKYLYVNTSEKNDVSMPDYTYVTTQNVFDVYENENFVPMGFTYDYYIDRGYYDDLSAQERSQVLLSAICLTDEQIQRYSDILDRLPGYLGPDLSVDTFRYNCQQRRLSAGDSFTYDNHGFTSHITLSKENLVFFSVPYDSGWSATVNGEPAEVEKVNIGFMAVKAPAGENTIRFTYDPPGLKAGSVVSAVGFTTLIIYSTVFFVKHRKQRDHSSK